MAEWNPDDLIGRIFLLPPNKRVTDREHPLTESHISFQKLDEDQESLAENINFLLDVGQQAIISYNQVLDYLEKDNQDEETLFKTPSGLKYLQAVFSTLVDW